MGLRIPPFVVISPASDIARVDEFLRTNAGPFAVRSSADVEDGESASFAGIFDSFLAVPRHEVKRRIEQVRASMNSVHAQEYSERVGASPGVMHVVVQRMVYCTISGIAFSRHPRKADRSILIEACWGLGETAVAGMAETDLIDVAPDSGLVLAYRTGQQARQLLCTADGPVDALVPYLDQSRRKVRSEQVSAIAGAVEIIRKEMGGEVDIEWGFDADGLVLLQARPITQ